MFESSHGLNSNYLSHPPLSLLLLYPPKVTGCASSYQQQQQLPSFSHSLFLVLLCLDPTCPSTQHICLLLTCPVLSLCTGCETKRVHNSFPPLFSFSSLYSAFPLPSFPPFFFILSFSSCLLSLQSLSHLCFFPLFLLFLCACLSSFSFPDLAVVSQTWCGSTVGGDRMIRSAALTPRRRARKSSFV